MSSNNSSSLPPVQKSCIVIEGALFGSNYAVLHIQLLLNAIILVAICVLLRQYSKNPIEIHKNLKILVANIIILYIINSFVWVVFFFRYRVLMYTYKNACDFLSPVWMVPLFLGPPKLYSVAYPIFHFAIAFERFRSTYLAEKYEYMCTRLIVKIICTIWLLSFAYMMFIICTALADPVISSKPQGVVTVTTANNADAMIYAMIVTMVLVFLTALFDWCIFVMNKLIHKATRDNPCEYNLSMNYQINENTLSMLVIFPIDLSFAFIYSLFNILSIVARAYRPILSTADFVTFCYWANTPLFLHSLLTVFVYIRFIKNVTKMRRRNIVNNWSFEHSKAYFKKLDAQWNQ